MGPFLSGSLSATTSFSIFIVSLGLCALTAFLETTVTTLRLFKLKELEQSRTKYKKLFSSLENNQSRVLTTILIAKNLADVTAATFGAELMNRVLIGYDTAISLWIGIIAVTTMILVFGEITPKIIAQAHGERFFSSTLWITNIIYYALFPVVNYCIPSAHFLMSRIFGNHATRNTSATSEKEIRFLIDYISDKGLMDNDKTAMLKSIFVLGTKPVRDIMAPASAMVSLDINCSVNEAMDLFNNYQFSRLPAYSGSKDHIIGMIYLKDVIPLCSHEPTTKLRDIVRPILFIPEGTKVNHVLKEFKRQHMHIGIVINEFGSILGLVTLEDILEEIVGEIHDEYETTPQKIVPLKTNHWLVDASIEIKDLTHWLHFTLETKTSQTLAGFLNEQFQHLPQKGECLTYKEYCFEVHEVGAKRILQVLIFPQGQFMAASTSPPPNETQTDTPSSTQDTDTKR